ncbi:MAG: hypothetical protein PHZ25_01040 [Candidatus Pacebacteria bacterium]|nr:hypothetical protein [Candidatus Paceibacterota bacterium]
MKTKNYSKLGNKKNVAYRTPSSFRSMFGFHKRQKNLPLNNFRKIKK